MLVQWEPS